MHDGLWYAATVTNYTPPYKPDPWRVEFKYDDGDALGSLLLDDDLGSIRRAHYRVVDEVTVEHKDGKHYQAIVTSYTAQGLPEPWRLGFKFQGGGAGALMLDDSFHLVRRQKVELQCVAQSAKERAQHNDDSKTSKSLAAATRAACKSVNLHINKHSTTASWWRDRELLAHAEKQCAIEHSRLQEAREKLDVAMSQCVEMIKVLIDACPGAATMRNKHGRTPLHYLASNYLVPQEVFTGMLLHIT